MAERYQWQSSYTEGDAQMDYYDTLTWVRAGLVRHDGFGQWRAMFQDTRNWRWHDIGERPMTYTEAKRMVEITARVLN